MNAKKELLEILGDNRIKCASILHDKYYEKEKKNFKLKIGYSPEEFNQFIDSLDFEYDNGYGGQELFGIVWFEDGTWLERGEYDGSELWEHKICPVIPKELI